MEKKYSKEELDRMAEEAFEEGEVERNFDLGFDAEAVVAGDKEAIEKFIRLRAAAKEAQDE